MVNFVPSIDAAPRQLRFAAAVLVAVSCLTGSLRAEVKKAKFNAVLKLGAAAPAWKDLPGVDDKKHSLEDYRDAPVLVLIFTCNHCPCAKDYEQRFIEFTNKYKDRGVQVVAINCNRNKADQLAAMKERAAAKKYPYAYLFDASQQTGRDYGAISTPQLFVLDRDRNMAYMGAFDDRNTANQVKKHFVEDAVTALLAGQDPPVRESRPRGCAINYE